MNKIFIFQYFKCKLVGWLVGWLVLGFKMKSLYRGDTWQLLSGHGLSAMCNFPTQVSVVIERE
jgi:hypothetical protein